MSVHYTLYTAPLASLHSCIGPSLLLAVYLHPTTRSEHMSYPFLQCQIVKLTKLIKHLQEVHFQFSNLWSMINEANVHN